jgi:hypothetical protein
MFFSTGEYTPRIAVVKWLLVVVTYRMDELSMPGGEHIPI